MKFLTPEKLCSVLFGTGKLKTTMKHHAANGAARTKKGGTKFFVMIKA